MTDDTIKVLGAVQMSKLTERYRKLTAEKSRLNKECETAVEKINGALELLSRAMLAKLHAEGATSQKTVHGTAYIYPQSTGTIVDFDVLWQHIKDNDAPELLQRRLTLSEVAAYNETHPDEPVPGVQVDIIQTVRVRAN